jgi:hypothetical protein
MLVKLLTRCGLPVAGLIFLSSCSSAPKTPPPVAAAVVSEKAPRPMRMTRSVTLAPAPAAPGTVSRSEQITRLVRAGALVEADKECLVFSVTPTQKPAPGGLFEDAIVLNRLRGQLKKISGLPESVAGTATVQGARAYLKINDAITAELAARAIESALKTDGVAVVHVTTAPEARL